MALVLLIDPTGMIISPAQESPQIPVNVNGGETNEPSDTGAFAALLFAVIAVPQLGGGIPSIEAADGNSVESASPAAGENGSATQSSAAGGEAPSFTATPSTLDAAQVVAAPASEENLLPSATPQQVPNPERVARAAMDFEFCGDHEQPIDGEQKIETGSSKLSDGASIAASQYLGADIKEPVELDDAPNAPVVSIFENTAKQTAGELQISLSSRSENIAPLEDAQPLTMPATLDSDRELSGPVVEPRQSSVPSHSANQTVANEIGAAPLAQEAKKEFTGAENRMISATGEPLPKASPKNSAKGDGVARIPSAQAETIFTRRVSTPVAGEMKEASPNTKPNQSRGSEQKSVQGPTAEAVEIPLNNTSPTHTGTGQKSFDREAQAFPNTPEEKNPINKEAGVTGGFSIESTSARPESRTQGEAEPAAWRPTMERLAGDIVSHVRIGARDAIIQLDPPELGKIKIDLRMDGDKLLARIAAESPEAQSLLKNHLPELHQALQSQQVNLAEVRVWQGGGSGAAADFAQNFQQAPGQRQPGGWQGGGAQEQPGAGHERPRPQNFSTGTGRVSLWV